MPYLEIQPVLDSSIPEVARFLHKQEGSSGENSQLQIPGCEDALSIERRLRWLLLENPLATTDSPHGFCTRDVSGLIRGLLLCFPNQFVAGDRRLVGLGSGGFFVEPQARTMGFYLFKKYLKLQGYSFFFSTTCNSNSAPLWKTLGGVAIPYSDLEYILPLRLHTLLPGLLAERTSRGAALAIADLLGRWGDRVMQFSQQRSAGITIEPTQDWQKLSWMFHRYRSRDSITTDRSPEFLEWRYGQNSDPYPSGVYLFRDKRGNEGWFSLGRAMRGRWRHIPTCALLDAIWPREKIGFSEILPAIVELVAGKFDLLSLRPQPGLDYGECSRWVIRRRRVVPGGFVIAANTSPRLTTAALDLSWADGDRALPMSPFLRSEAESDSEIEWRKERSSLW
jgi:hypothetical protein